MFTSMKRKGILVSMLAGAISTSALTACETNEVTVKETVVENEVVVEADKVVLYQVFTRLFGNTNSTNKPWGTIDENGVGKFADFTDEALSGIKEMGVTHVWYTGVPHHAVINDYTQYGIENDDPDVVKGRAGSPYAVKDYYSVNPDLAIDPANRVAEFEALISRTHNAGMKVVIDIVPNHIARNYQSLDKPAGVEDFGASDNTNVSYARDNDFYYVVGEGFKVPESLGGYLPLGGEKHLLADAQFIESPAKWTGNGSRAAQPNFHDWYETVKINYGVKPDGSLDFATLPAGYELKGYKQHFEFWQQQDVPNSWVKFRDIALYWVDKGVDGFRYDMAEMVPVEFWSYMNSSIKMKNPDAFLLAEIYNPKRYRDYIHLGKMDYLYDKVDLYDRLKEVMQGKGSSDELVSIRSRFTDIDAHLLNFLENHDEQRIASPEFAGSAAKGKPAMVISTMVSAGPIMLYFGQDVGEDGSEETGFGDPSRTTIFDYAGVPAHQRWMNNGKFDGGQLSAEEASLRDFYRRLLNFAASSSAVTGEFADLHQVNRSKNHAHYTESMYAFARFDAQQKLFVVANLAEQQVDKFKLFIPSQIVSAMKLDDGSYVLTDKLNDNQTFNLTVIDNQGYIDIELDGLESLILAM